jgi:hypothetical protein
MGAKIFMGLSGAAIVFMLYALFHFVEEGQQHPHVRPNAKVVIIDRARTAQQRNSKAA